MIKAIFLHVQASGELPRNSLFHYVQKSSDIIYTSGAKVERTCTCMQGREWQRGGEQIYKRLTKKELSLLFAEISCAPTAAKSQSLHKFLSCLERKARRRI